MTRAGSLPLLLLLAACSSSPSGDITGPFTGPVHRFVVDRILVPATTDASAAVAGDLDGNGTPDNKLGLVTAVLATTNDLSLDGPDMIAAGALASVVEIQADDLATDATVGVRYFGIDPTDPATAPAIADAIDAATVVAGGALVDGTFLSNRTATTRHPGRAIVVLPVYTNADPLALPLEGLEIDLHPDGRGGFDAILRGGIREADARALAYAGLIQMFENEPERHLVFQRQIDRDRDGTMSRAELDDSIIATLVTADIQLFDGTRYAPRPAPTAKDSLSIAFAAHLLPCPDDGRCSAATTPILDHCRDRIRDGNESDVDCGGSCLPCFDGRTCTAPGDCQSNACAASSNTCVPATCTDGVRDGFESDVDCGGSCPPCTQGRICAADSDCTSNNCNNGPAVTGTCQ